MPALNWGKFTSLQGGAERNFEILCRGIVRLNFGSYGAFRALANQPGVEFHLKLDKRCDALGDPGRWRNFVAEGNGLWEVSLRIQIDDTGW